MANVWTTKTSATTATKRLGCAVIGTDKAYAVCGTNSSDTNLQNNQQYSKSGDSWAVKTDYPVSDDNSGVYMRAVGLGSDTYYALKSKDTGGNPIREYSESGNSWASKATTSLEIDYCGASALDTDKAHFVGYTSSVNYHEQYSKSGNSFTSKTLCSGLKYMGPAQVTIGSRIYSIGGSSTWKNAEYIESTDSWASKTAAPITNWNRHGNSGGGVVNSKAYIFGGNSGVSLPTVKCYEYDQSGNSWTQKADVPNNRQDHGAGTMGTYDCFGFCGSGGASSSSYAEVYKYVAADPPVYELYEDLPADLQLQWPFQLEDLKIDARAYAWLLEDLKADLQLIALTELVDLKADLSAYAWNTEDLEADLKAYGWLLTDLNTYLALQGIVFTDLKCELSTADLTGPYLVVASLSPVPSATNVPTNLNVLATYKDDGWGVKPSTCWIKIKDESSSVEEQWDETDEGWSGVLSTNKRQYDVTLNPLCKLPTAPSVTPQTTGGSMSDGSYYYVITAVTPNGETLKGIESAVATVSGGGGSGSVDLSWTAVPFATGYKVYRTTTSGSYSDPALVGSPSTNSMTDTSASPSAGAPPATNTADIEFENVRQLTFTAYGEDEAGNTGLSSQ